MSAPTGVLPPAPMYSIYNQTARAVFSSSFSSGAWPTANKAFFIPITLATVVVVQKLWWINGATASNNVDIGIYTSGGVKLVSSGSTARSGINALQSASLGTPLTLTPGAYYMALASDGTTGTNFRASLSTPNGSYTEMLMQTSAFPLPATATFATSSAETFLPLFGFSTVTTI